MKALQKKTSREKKEWRKLNAFRGMTPLDRESWPMERSKTTQRKLGGERELNRSGVPEMAALL